MNIPIKLTISTLSKRNTFLIKILKHITFIQIIDNSNTFLLDVNFILIVTRTLCLVL